MIQRFPFRDLDFDTDGIEQVDSNPSTGEAPPIPEQPPSNPFGNIGGKADLDELLKQAEETPKQNYTTPGGQSEGDISSDTDIPGSDPLKGEKPLKVSKESQAAAKMVMHTFDTGWSIGAQMITEAPDRSKYKADEDDFNELVEAWALYIESVGMKIPPWLGVALLMTVVYLFKIPTIIKDKKAFKALKLEADRKAAEKAARDEAVRNAEQSSSESKLHAEKKVQTAEHTDQNGVKSSVDVTEVITKCLYCSKPLLPHQIKRGGKYCSPAHAAKYQHEILNKSK